MSQYYILDWTKIPEKEKEALSIKFIELIKHHETYSGYRFSFNPKYVTSYKTFYLLTDYHEKGANHVGWSSDNVLHFSSCKLSSQEDIIRILTSKMKKFNKKLLSFKMNIIESPIKINQVIPVKYLAVYGTLKKFSKKGYNFNRFGGQTYIDDIKLHPYIMFNLGNYPAIIDVDKAGKIADNIHPVVKGELHSVSLDAFNKIKEMEIGAGYIESEFVWGKRKASVFVANSFEMVKNCKIIEHGDWIQ